MFRYLTSIYCSEWAVFVAENIYMLYFHLSGWPTDCRDMWLWGECVSDCCRDVSCLFPGPRHWWQCLHSYDHQSPWPGVECYDSDLQITALEAGFIKRF